MTWLSRVVCEHTALVARAETLDAWQPHATTATACGAAEPAGEWLVGVSAGSAEARSQVLTLLRSVSGARLPVGSALARLTRCDLPACSVLLSDGELAAGLAWGEPLGLSEIGAWEFTLSSAPLPDHGWTPLVPGTIAVLDSCGPTLFPVPLRVPDPQETP